MPKMNPILSDQPHKLKVEALLRDRPGVMWVSLLTDECGCACLARGDVPEYLRQQALDALEWCGTAERKLCG